MDQSNQAVRAGDRERLQPRTARHAAWLVLAVVLSLPVRAAGRVQRFRLPAEPFPQAILDFYRQSGVQAIYAATPDVEQLETRAVSGQMDGATALRRMLQGTGLTFVFDTDRMVIIRHTVHENARHRAPARPSPALRRDRARPRATRGANRLRKVEVTGSLLHDVRDAVAPLLYIRHRQLAQAPYASVQDALYALPLVSMNGPREDLGIDGNYQYGAGIDLRGLGVGATLVLVDGGRQPLAGLSGDFVDVSTIPWSAVRRIEVLPDGASALYGSDAIAGVVNIIMRDRFHGAQTVARYATARNGRGELMLAQLIGASWSGGHAMLAYQFSDATPLSAAERAYAADADKAGYGGGDYDSYYGNPGNILDPRTLQPAYGIPRGQDGRSLSATQLTSVINLQNPFVGYQIFPERTAHEVYASASEHPSPALRLFVRVRYALRDTRISSLPNLQVLLVPSSNAFYVNPYPAVPYTLVAYSFLRDFGPIRFSSRSRLYMGTIGGTLRLRGRWQLTLSESDGSQSLRDDESNVPDPLRLAAALADPNPATAFDPFGDGSYTSAATLSALNRDFRLGSSAGLQAMQLIADGPLLRLPAGEARLAVGVGRRLETLEHSVPDPTDPQARTSVQQYSRHVVSVFSQLAVPLMGARRNARATPRLMLNLAGRYEHYGDFGGTFDPTARLRWSVNHWLALRGSWGRSFRAPKLDDLYDTSQNLAELALLPDPMAPTGRALALVEQGSNPHLRRETAHTWTAGFDLAPWRGSQLSLSYYSIDYFNRIEQPAVGDPLAILAHAAEWAPVITRAPTPAQVAALCNSPVFVGSVSQCLASRPAAIIDMRLANLATTRTSGLDLSAHQRLGSRWGRFGFGLQGNYVFDFLQSVTASSPAVSILDTLANPLALRLRGTLDWSRRGPRRRRWSVRLAVNYTGAYRNPDSVTVPRVAAWTSVDLEGSCRWAGLSGSGATDLTLNVVNVLDRAPPFVDNPFGYDVANVQALGRVLGVQLTERW